MYILFHRSLKKINLKKKSKLKVGNAGIKVPAENCDKRRQFITHYTYDYFIDF